MAREGLMDDCGYNFDVDEDSYNSGFKDGFLMAVDEFAEKLKELFKYESAWSETQYYQRLVIDISKIDEIVEQMKEE
jgi:hypothetical protein